MNTSNDTLFTREEAAKYLNIQPNTLAVWASCKRYNLPYVRVGRCARYRLSDLKKFLEENLQNGGNHE